MTMDDESKSFHRDEYNALRQEVLSIFSQRDKYLFLSVGACGLVIAWLTLNVDKLPQYFWLAPLVIVVVTFSVVRSLSLQMRKIGEYLERLETKYASSDVGGWEHYQQGARAQRPFFTANRLLWGIFLVAMTVFALQRYV